MTTPTGKMNAVPWLAALFTVAGCAANGGPPESGFLSDYSGLVKEQGEKGVWTYNSPNVTYAEYQSVMIDPFVLGFSPHKVLATAKQLNDLATHMHDSVAKIVAERYPVVDKPSKGTLRLRIALTNLEPSTGPGSAEWSSGYLSNVGVELGSASFEGETVDSVTGERVHAFIAVNLIASDTGDDGRWGQAVGAMNEFARRFREALDEAHTGSR
jgi:hypothetical protein